MVCPNDCSDHGQCLSMAEAAAGLDGYRLTRVASYDAWDAHMIYVSLQYRSAFNGKRLVFHRILCLWYDKSSGPVAHYVQSGPN